MSFGGVAGGVQANLNKHGIYSVWYDFTLGGLHCCSTSNNMFVSFEYKKTGTGQANTFTINLAYVPEPGGDPNAIDRALAIGDRSSSRGCKAKIQYGYAGEFGCVSPRYEGEVTDYTCEIREGMLYYTITGYSGIVYAVNTKESFDEVGTLEEDGTCSDGIQPSEQIVKVVNEKLARYGYTCTKSSNSGPFIADESCYIKRYDDVQIFDYMTNVLATAHASKDNSTEIIDRTRYTFAIDDAKKKIIIKSIDLTAASTITMTFNWMSRENSIVLNFLTDFRGAVPITVNRAAEEELESDDINRSVINAKGTTTSVQSYEQVSSSDFVSESNIVAARWAELLQTPYTATLTLIGVPADGDIIGEMITVNPLIYGVKHHTAGKYMITGVTDIIDAGGYQSVVKLMKVSK